MDDFKLISAADLVRMPDEAEPRKVFQVIHDDRPVKVTGEPLDQVIWQGRQWVVTTHGIEARDGNYAIDKRRLAEDMPLWSWPQQMGEKAWVDIEDFITAWMVALAVHGARVAPEKVAQAVERAARR